MIALHRRDPNEAALGIKYRKIRVLPPIGKQRRYPTLTCKRCLAATFRMMR